MTKSEFLKTVGFPDEWLAWGFYPDPLFEVQRALDISCEPNEHVRLGAFVWWLRNDRNLPEHALAQLAQLAALDPDPSMSGAATFYILYHPSATEQLAENMAELAECHAGWRAWASQPTPREFFLNRLDEGRKFWLERFTVHRIACDLAACRIPSSELREIYASASPMILRGLVRHPNLTKDLLVALTKLEQVKFTKEIRQIARLRLEQKELPRTNFGERYSTDPWSWPF